MWRNEEVVRGGWWLGSGDCESGADGDVGEAQREKGRCRNFARQEFRTLRWRGEQFDLGSDTEQRAAAAAVAAVAAVEAAAAAADTAAAATVDVVI